LEMAALGQENWIPTSEPPLPFFEGTEKRLEIVFSQNNDVGIRCLTKEEWNHILEYADCVILGDVLSTEQMDSYILSQSSIFIRPFRIVIKTCGTSSLLHCIPVLVEYAKKANTEIETVFFSHQNYIFPDRQPAPHHDIETETEYLRKYFCGDLRVLGSKEEGSHWSMFTSTRNLGNDLNVTHSLHSLEIMMSNLDPDVMKQFHHIPGDTTPNLLKRTGISEILLDCDHVDGHIFQPWGFSLNALNNDVYVTIHVTPEEEGSFVSFETNFVFHCFNKLRAAIQRVLNVFKPGNFCLLVVHEDPSLREEETFLEFSNYIRGKTDFLLVEKKGFYFFEFFIKN